MDQSTTPINRAGLAGVTTAYLLWGLLPLYWKMLVDIPSGAIVCHRIIWSFVFSLILVRRGNDLFSLLRHPARARILAVSLACAILLTANWLIYIWAVNNGQIVEASLGYFINPLIAVLLGVIILRERLRPGQWLALGVAMGGVFYLTFSYGSFPWIGLSLALTFATYSLLRKTAVLHSLSGLVLETGMLALPALAALLILARQEPVMTGGWHGLLLIGSGPVTALPLLLFVFGAQRVTMTLVGLMQYLAPSLQFLIGLVIFHEDFPPEKLTGFSLIWTALLLYTGEHLLHHWRQRQTRLAAR